MAMISTVNGLRAIAILLVVFYHFFPSVLVGGFVGVDIFFVISGFLITGILLKDDGLVHISSFYQKRIRRILPAIVPVVIGTVLLGYHVLLPDELRSMGLHLLGVGTFSTNFTLMKEAGYFDGVSEYKPYLHFWSLAVEIQFYLVYPWFLRLISRQQRAGRLYFSVMAASFVLNVFFYKTHRQDLDFYLLPSRLWEFMAGGGIYFLHGKAKKIVSSPRFFWLFLILTLLVVVKFDGRNHYPGVRAVIPVLFSLSLLAGGLSSGWLYRVFISKTFRFISDISYPWYLWHWSIIVFAGFLLADTMGVWVRPALLILSLLLGWLTHIGVEKPFRKVNSAPALFGFGAVVTVFISSIGGFIYLNNGLPARDFLVNGKSPTQAAFSSDLLALSRTNSGNDSCAVGMPLAKDLVCLQTAPAPKILILGDSHAMAIHSALAVQRISYPSVLVAAHGCLPVNVDGEQDTGSRPDCQQVIPVSLALLKTYPSIEKVWVITKYAHTNNLNPDQKRRFVEQFTAAFRSLARTSSNKKVAVTLLLDYPDLKVEPRTCVPRPWSAVNENQINKNCDQSSDEVQHRQAENKQLLRDAAQAAGEMTVVDLQPYFCDKLQCHGATNQTILYFDTHHLTIHGSEYVLNKLVVDKLHF